MQFVCRLEAPEGIAFAGSESHLHKALTQANPQLRHVISDLAGVTGQAILTAILAGKPQGN